MVSKQPKVDCSIPDKHWNFAHAGLAVLHHSDKIHAA
jgi:hypothetical protein